jgi:cyanophycinase
MIYLPMLRSNALRSTVEAVLWSIMLLFLAATPSHSQEFDERFDDWPVDLKINGEIAAGESVSSKVLEQYLTSLGKPTALLITNFEPGDATLPLEWLRAHCDSVQIVSVNEVNDTNTWDAKLWVWCDKRRAPEIEQPELQRLKRSFSRHIQEGNTVLALGPCARTTSKHWVASVLHGHPTISPGMGLLPDCVLETAIEICGVGKPQLQSVLASQPRCVGIGLDRESLLVLGGRKIRVLGEGKATFLLNASERHPIRSQTILQSVERERSPEKFLVDLTEWRRDAIDRTLEPFPPIESEKPVVPSGTLVIVGGGGMPEGLMSKFVELAGGVERAKLVYVPCEESDSVSSKQGTVESWLRMGVQQATFLHTKDRVKANEDEPFLEPLREATGVWFGGGRQWNLADSYYGTKAHRWMKEVLKRGGVIGGSSAGASIQASYLARATPIENFKIMAPGYERGGLGFIRGVAIDQHFTQRRRQADMSQLVSRYPQLLGIGIDEATAILVNGSLAKVAGKGKVHFYDRNKPLHPGEPDFEALTDGQTYDLAARKIVETQVADPR